MPRLVPALAAVAILVGGSGRPLAAQAPERHVLSGERVAIWNLAGRAELVAGSGREVVVELSRGGEDGAQLTVEASGGRLVVKYPGRDLVYRDREDSHRYSSSVSVADDGTFSGGWNDDRGGRNVRIRSSGSGLEAHANLRILVPAGQRIAVYLGVGTIEASNVNGELELRTQASPIRVTGGRGRVEARTGSGRILIEDVDGERVQASTGSGAIDLARVRGGEMRLSTGSGSVEARDVRAERMDVSTGSGGVRLEFTAVPRDVTARTGSGSVSLALPEGANLDLDIRTGSGGITTDFPVTMDEVRRNELRGRIGNGNDGRVRVTAGSGSVRLTRN